MRKAICPAAGSVLLAAYAAYALLGIRTPGPADKLVQLAVLFPGILCLAWWLAGRVRGDLAASAVRLVGRLGTGRFLCFLSAVLLVFSVWMAYGPLEGTAKGGDEAAVLFQARIFAAGELAAPAPPDADTYFPCRHLISREGMWFGQYTPTHSILLAPFAAAGISPLLGPLEGVLSLVGLFLLVRIWAGERAARLTSLLLLASPFFLMMTPTHMAHNSNLMLVVWSLYLISLYWKEGGFARAVGSGLLLGLALTTKPYPIAVWGLFLGIALALGGRKGLKGLAGMALGALPPVAGLLYTNWVYTGDPLLTPYQLARGDRLLGFGENKAWYPIFGDYRHTLWRSLQLRARELASGATMLFGWPLLSLVPMLASVALFGRERRLLYLSLTLVGMFLLLLPHSWPGVIYGPRHYYTFLPVVLYLSLRGLGVLHRAAAGRWAERGGSFVFLTVAGLFGITLLLYLPERIGEMSGPWLAVESAPYIEAREEAETPALIFMEASQHGYPSIYSGLNYTSPFLDGEMIFCVHQSVEEDLALIRQFPERSAYLYWVDGEGEHHVVPWSGERAGELTPSRELHRPPAPPE